MHVKLTSKGSVHRCRLGCKSELLVSDIGPHHHRQDGCEGQTEGDAGELQGTAPQHSISTASPVWTQLYVMASIASHHEIFICVDCRPQHCDGTEAEMKPLNPKAGGAGASTANFFETAEEIALGVTEIQNNVRELRNCQKRIFTEPSRVERDKHQAKRNDLVDINKSLGQKVQNLIRRETERTGQFEKKAKTSQELSELRLRKTQERYLIIDG